MRVVIEGSVEDRTLQRRPTDDEHNQHDCHHADDSLHVACGGDLLLVVLPRLLRPPQLPHDEAAGIDGMREWVEMGMRGKLWKVD